MARIVMKFGGTSVADLDRIRRVAALVAAEHANGNEVAVVVSAMSGETNRLVGFVELIDSTYNLIIFCAIFKCQSCFFI